MLTSFALFKNLQPEWETEEEQDFTDSPEWELWNCYDIWLDKEHVWFKDKWQTKEFKERFRKALYACGYNRSYYKQENTTENEALENSIYAPIISTRWTDKPPIKELPVMGWARYFADEAVESAKRGELDYLFTEAV